MAKVFFWTAQDDGASWYRADLPSMALGWSGHQTWVGTVPIPSVMAKADVVVVSRPAQPKALEFLEANRTKYGFRVVADLDDDYWAITDAPEHAHAYQEWHPGSPLLEGLGRGLEMADVVTVAAAGEAEAVLRNTSQTNVQVVPNGLHASILGLPRDYENGQQNDGKLTIGWAGTGSSSGGLKLCVDQLVRLLRAAGARDRVRLRLVGFNPDHQPEVARKLQRAADDGADIAWVPWVQHGDPYLVAVSMFDIWLAPYEDTEFNRAKFATKALEAGFWGIPLVTSNVRPYAEWFANLQPEDHPKLVSAYLDHQWFSELRKLIQDPRLRRRYGEAAQSEAAKYSLQEVGRQWESVLFG